MKVHDKFELLIESEESFIEVSNILLKFVNKVMEQVKINLSSLVELKTEQLVMLISLLGGFFVPLSKWTLAPASEEDKLHNVNTVVELLKSLDIETERIKSSEIVGGDAKAIARCIFALQQRYDPMI